MDVTLSLKFLGGCKHAAGNLFFAPTILTDVSTDMECFKSEIFGPVVAVKRFDSEKVTDSKP